ncbi:MAG TPA: DUF6491 family protein [Woeseiaceae bacterium]|nr:DUF6491 family protein [Woeseiaceae bacterium]
MYQRVTKNLKLFVLSATALLGACATGYDMQDVEAVRDYVVANQLKEVDEFRYFRQINYTYINDQFLVVPIRTGDYLIEFRRGCRELRQSEFTYDMVDRRDSQNRIRAGFDTIRGCTIDKIYEISEAQRKELVNLGDAPGDEVYLPDDDD